MKVCRVERRVGIFCYFRRYTGSYDGSGASALWGVLRFVFVQHENAFVAGAELGSLVPLYVLAVRETQPDRVTHVTAFMHGLNLDLGLLNLRVMLADRLADRGIADCRPHR